MNGWANKETAEELVEGGESGIDQSGDDTIDDSAEKLWVGQIIFGLQTSRQDCWQ